MNRSTHMMTAAIAFSELMDTEPVIIDHIIEFMSYHPERGPFEVAVGGASGAEKARRMFMAMARWPDDVRGGASDHPTWHAMARPIVDVRRPPLRPPANGVVYDGFEAFALNLHVACNGRAPNSERAVALCWLLHLVGDVHQPLHTAELYSDLFPEGDQFGGLIFLLDPETGAPVNLHWYWDFLVSRPPEPAVSLRRASELRLKFPRERFAAQIDSGRSCLADFAVWADESYEIARTVAYGPTMPLATSPEQATAVDKAYVQASVEVAEQHFTLAGYRLGELLRKALASA